MRDDYTGEWWCNYCHTWIPWDEPQGTNHDCPVQNRMEEKKERTSTEELKWSKLE